MCLSGNEMSVIPVAWVGVQPWFLAKFWREACVHMATLDHPVQLQMATSTYRTRQYWMLKYRSGKGRLFGTFSGTRSEDLHH